MKVMMKIITVMIAMAETALTTMMSDMFLVAYISVAIIVCHMLLTIITGKFQQSLRYQPAIHCRGNQCSS